MSIITTERLTKILSETQSVITQCNSRGVHGSVEVNVRLFENVLMELLRHRAAMLQGADAELQRKAAVHDTLCEKYNVESLADFVEWQRNHIAELEAAPPAPVGPGETAVMPDYSGYAMTQRECFDVGAKRAAQKAWVACSERMPEVGGMYLCYVQDEYEFDISHFCFEYLAAHKKFDSAGINITHWMPLPAAPKQEVKQCT